MAAAAALPTCLRPNCGRLALQALRASACVPRKQLRCVIAAAAAAAAEYEQVWRPSVEDVQRISRGDAARARGTGSRAVPHRLNAEERAAFDVACKKWVLALAGSGYRRERKGAPLANLWRQWCDAAGMPCVLVCKGASAAAGDTVLVDLSTLRLRDASQYVEACRAIAAQHGVAPLPPSAQQSPFTVILPPALVEALMELEAGGGSSGSSGSDSGSCGGTAGPGVAGAAAAEAADAAADAAAAAGGSGGASPAVQELLSELRCGAPIWQHPPQLQCFSADRSRAKALAKQLAEELGQLAAAGGA